MNEKLKHELTLIIYVSLLEWINSETYMPRKPFRAFFHMRSWFNYSYEVPGDLNNKYSYKNTFTGIEKLEIIKEWEAYLNGIT